MHIEEVNRARDFVLSADLSKVSRSLSARTGMPESDATEIGEELKKYLFLCYAQKRRYGMMGVADDFWHEFIVHTKDYTDFCNTAFGSYLHHSPASDAAKLEAADNLMYIRFLIDYFRFYKSPPPKHIWPFSFELFGEASDWEIAQANCVADCFTRCIHLTG